MENGEYEVLRDRQRRSAQERLTLEQFARCEAIITASARGRFAEGIRPLSYHSTFAAVLLRKEIIMVQMLGTVFGKSLTTRRAARKVQAAVRELCGTENFSPSSVAFTEAVGWTAVGDLGR